ncbi:MAG: Crp/Fnr family transcriptional regulator [Betaproteobacteria bacterium]|nr:Crp/Fnr family transcriptional regulator [Betaproteobacteria bacterium]
MSDEKRLLKYFRGLPSAQRETLLAFAEFLAGRHEVAAPELVGSPVALARPVEESVVKAIKRLRATYPMVDASKLLHETSHYMSQHVMQGKPAKEVIDELEVVFARHYERLTQPEEAAKPGDA